MTKRELLELAAKAAGIEYREDRIEFDGEYGLPLKNLPSEYSNWSSAPYWNPIVIEMMMHFSLLLLLVLW